MQRPTRSWGIARTQTAGTATESSGYSFDADACGAGVTVYVIDSGLSPTHREFRASDGTVRAVRAHNGVSNEPDADYIGHGTHVASTVTGETVGLARCTSVEAVKVCDFYGSCSLDSLLSGMGFVANAGKPNSIANMSLGGQRNPVFNEGAEAMERNGVLVVAAAGNDRRDACDISPAGAEGIYTVMASDEWDRWASGYSNFGPCTDITAPGSFIRGAWRNGDNAESQQTGTSMAAPHVCGVMAKLWSQNLSMSKEEVIEAVEAMALRGVLEQVPAGTTDLFLHMPGCQ